jgi:hypothetical protein
MLSDTCLTGNDSSHSTIMSCYALCQQSMQLSEGESMNAEQQDVKFQQLLAEAKDYERSCVEPAMVSNTPMIRIC